MNLTPAEYATLQGACLYDWQAEALESVGNGWPTSLVTCNGAGKTTEVASAAVAWFFAKHPRGKLVATSGSFNQLQNQLWPAIKSKLPRSFTVLNGTSPCIIRTPHGGMGIGFSTNDARRAEGWHPTISPEVDPVFVLVDEGKAVPYDIFVAFDRCTVAYLLYISSPGPPSGRFYDTHHSLKRYYYTRRVSSLECPHIDPDKRERDKAVLGEDSPEYRSMHLAEFTDLDNAVIITPSRLEMAARGQPLPDKRGERVAFFDFAAGGDENVFALRHGNTVEIIDAWRQKNTVQAVHRFIAKAREMGLSSGECWGDGDGIGMTMIDVFHDEGFPINSFRGGMPALSSEEYNNLISEVWIQGIRKIERGLVHIGELDAMTKNQLTTRHLEWAKNGKLKVESKEDMAKRGVKSPDRADALLGAIMCGSYMTGAITSHTVEQSEVGGNMFGAEVVNDF